MTRDDPITDDEDDEEDDDKDHSGPGSIMALMPSKATPAIPAGCYNVDCCPVT